MSRSVNLQRRHFEFIADVLLELKPSMEDSEHGRIVRYIGNRLGTTNANFKDDRFYHRARGIVKSKPVRVRKAKPLTLDTALKAVAAVKLLEEEDTNYWE